MSMRQTCEQESPAAFDASVFDAIPAETAVLDGQGTILAANAAWRRSGLAAVAAGSGSGATTTGSWPAPGDNLLEFFRRGEGGLAPADARSLVAGLEAVLRGTRGQFSLEYARGNGGQRFASADATATAPEPRWYLLLASPLRVEPASPPRGAVVMQLDITDRKLADMARLKRARASLRRRAEQLLVLARQLKQRNAELDQFAYITTHDLRAPLRGIANLSRWIEEDLGDRFTPEAHQQMELLRGRVQRMESLIDAILQYSRAGRTRLKSQRVDVRELVSDVVDLLAPPPGFTIEIGSPLPVLETDPVPLQQVFMNLIGNAIKHHNQPQQGRVTITCRDAGELYEFAVSDNGPGIDPQYHERIFVIFQTLAPRDKVEGTGVGLALVQKLVERQGGRVSVESELGAGATFRFTWPKQPPPPRGAPPPQRSRPQQPSTTQP
ncbi:sensor histidine kinase [Fontivita pretiosa]|uniref:sensor histidine kinase n=1 Tax=Fontivita pretiosa TaxID=2989684 RepID=UPI003D1687B6